MVNMILDCILTTLDPNSPANIIMSLSSMLRLSMKALLRTAFAAYAAGLLSLFLPSEQVLLDGGSYSTWLVREHSGKIAGSFLLFAGALQAWGWLKGGTSMAWPGWVAGWYITIFASIRIMRLWAQNNSLQEPDRFPGAAVHPQAGLFLLLASGITLLVLQVLASRQNSR